MNAIEKINFIFLDGKSLTKEDIEKLWDNPTLKKIGEVVWIDRSNNNWLIKCKIIKDWFIEDIYNKEINRKKETNLLNATNKIIELSKFYNRLNFNEMVNRNDSERHSIIEKLNSDIKYISELLSILTNDIKREEYEINMYLNGL